MDWTFAGCNFLRCVVAIFFLLVREISGDAAAIWATFFYSFAPLNVFAGRSFMPDVPSLSLALIGLYFFLRWIDSEKSTSLFAAAIVISLALLIKLPSAIIAAPFLFLVWQKWRWNFLRRPALWLFAAITILPSTAWYWHAHQIAEKFYPHHFFGAGEFRSKIFHGIGGSCVDWNFEPYAGALDFGDSRLICGARRRI
jgi:4-amino-4-deoxy-L-arabinose transferase-like glycosyltransferase